MTQVKHNAVKYTSTGQFRNVCQNMVHHFQSTMVEIDGVEQWIVDRNKPLPTEKFVGTVKIHGTNGSMIQFADQKIYCQSKSRILDITHDNSGFYERMSHVDKESLFEEFKELYRAKFGKEPAYPIIIAGEWAGSNIQKGVAVSEVEKFFSIFGFRVGVDIHAEWINAEVFPDFHRNENRIYNICQFGLHEVVVDFSNPKAATPAIEKLVLEIEEECPVGKFFGVEGIGEGLVWKPAKAEFASNSGYWFKTKGQKHSVSKVKKLVAISPEKLNSINEFVEYAATTNRFDQGIDETGLDMKLVGKFIGWVNGDIWKEEADVLAENNLTMKDVGRDLSNKARKYYIEKVNSQF